MRKNKYTAFTLAEMMVVMLIMSIILAAMAPVMTTRNKIDNSSPWRYSPQNASNAYFGAGQAMHALIGQVEATESDNGKLVINTLGSSMSHLLFKSNNDVLGDLYFSESSVVLGNRRAPANSIGTNNVNIGHNNWPANADITGSHNIVIGSESMQALSGGTDNISIGDNSLNTTTGNGNIAIGGNANQTSNTHSTIAIGRNSSAQGLGAIAIGANRLATENEGTAINGALAGSRESIAIGGGALAEQTASIAIGEKSKASDTKAIAIGKETTAQSEGSIAIGHDITSVGTNSIAIGGSDASGENTVALNGDTTGPNTIAINGVAERRNSVAINGSTDNEFSVAINGTANGENTVAINGIATGDPSSIAIIGDASGNYSIAIGKDSRTTDSSGIAIGTNSTTNGNRSVAIGTYALANTSNSVAIGPQAEAKGYASVAIGYGACNGVTGSNKVCIGTFSGPPSSSSWAKDGQERIFIGSKSKFNGQDAVLEIHNLDTQRTGGAYDKLYYGGNCKLMGGCNRLNNTTVYINGNLVVRGTTFLTSKHWNGNNFAEKAIEYTHDAMKGAPNEDGSCSWLPNTSDRRLKYVGKENTAGLEKIRQLKIFNFTYKKDPTKDPHVGVIAQDLQKVFPNAVKKGADGFLTIRMEDMFYAVINAIKELDAKYQAQEKRIDALEKRIEKLEANKAK